MRAASSAATEGLIRPVLLGRHEDIVTACQALGVSVRGIEAVYPVDDPAQDQIIALFQTRNPHLELTDDHVRAIILAEPIVYGLGLLRLGRADALIAMESDDHSHNQKALEYFFDPEDPEKNAIVFVPQRCSPRAILEALAQIKVGKKSPELE